MNSSEKIVTQLVRIDQNWGSDQKKPRMFVGYLPASALIREDVFDIDVWEPGKIASGPQVSDSGYQRAPAITRRKQIAQYVTTAYTLLPTAVLLSAREFSLEPKYLKQAESGDPEQARRYVLTIDPAKMKPDHKFYIIDGQHRVAGLRYAIEEMEQEAVANMEIPIVLIDNCRYFEEVMQFAVINKEAKRVPSQLALQHAAQLRHDDERYNWLLKDSLRWQDRANQVVRWLEDSPDSPWHERILLPNQKPRRDQRGYPKVRSFVDSLKPLMKPDPERPTLDDGEVKRFLVSYWTAIRELCPECFNSPSEHVLLKTNGVFSLHMIARSVMEKVGALFGYKKYLEKKNVKKLLAEMPSMKSSFWKSKPSEDASSDDLIGEAAKYGGMKGFAMLAELLQKHLAEAEQRVAEERSR